MLLSFLLISCLAGIFTACDEIEDEYITDSQMSILQENRASLNYLLKNSTYGTAPGTYPETWKYILNAALTELDALITRVEACEELDETTLEAAVAKVNQATDEFKNSKYNNLSPEAQQYINNFRTKSSLLLSISTHYYFHLNTKYLFTKFWEQAENFYLLPQIPTTTI